MKLENARGDWALVTGASSGIGREFAVHLATAGVNLVLVARREHLLKTLASELATQHSIKTIALSADLSQTDAIATVKNSLTNDGIKIRILVNNAAIACWGHFENISPKTHTEMICLNTVAMVYLCQHFFQDLSSFQTSVIINISSPAGFNAIPYMAVYAASKAFVTSFSQALYGEWKDHGIHVQTLIPGPTETELGIAASEFNCSFGTLQPTANIVKTSLAQLDKKSPIVSNARGTFKQRVFATLFPARIVIKTLARIFKPPE